MSAEIDDADRRDGRLHVRDGPHPDRESAGRRVRGLRAASSATGCARFGFDVEYLAAEGRPEHTRTHPRVNVVGHAAADAAQPAARAPERPLRRRARRQRAGRSIRSAGVVSDGRIYGRGTVRHEGRASPRRCTRRKRSAAPASTCPARSRSAARWTRRAAASPAWPGSPSRDALSAGRTDYVIIPEPLDVDRICIGHRGVYWFEVTTTRPHRARQHAVPRRERDRAHGRCCSTRSAPS